MPAREALHHSASVPGIPYMAFSACGENLMIEYYSDFISCRAAAKTEKRSQVSLVWRKIVCVINQDSMISLLEDEYFKGTIISASHDTIIRPQ
jgi:hypothetical protein